MLKQKRFNDGMPLTKLLGPRGKRRPLPFIATDCVGVVVNADIILARDARTGETLTLVGRELVDRIEAGEDVGEHFVPAINLNMRSRDVQDLVSVITDLREDCNPDW